MKVSPLVSPLFNKDIAASHEKTSIAYPSRQKERATENLDGSVISIGSEFSSKLVMLQILNELVPNCLSASPAFTTNRHTAKPKIAG